MKFKALISILVFLLIAMLSTEAVFSEEQIIALNQTTCGVGAEISHINDSYFGQSFKFISNSSNATITKISIYANTTENYTLSIYNGSISSNGTSIVNSTFTNTNNGTDFTWNDFIFNQNINTNTTYYFYELSNITALKLCNNSTYANGDGHRYNISAMNDTSLGNDILLMIYLNTTDLVTNTTNSTNDTIFPSITIISPTNTTPYPNSSIYLEITASDDVNLTETTYNINGSANTTYAGAATLTLLNGNYIINAYAKDSSNNTNSTSVSFLVNDSSPPDVTSSGPSGTKTTTSITLNATTDEDAVCKYHTSDVAYDSMSGNFSGNQTTHTKSLTSLSTGSHTYYVRCNDTNGNVMTSSANISFTISISTGNTGGSDSTESITTPGYGFELPVDEVEVSHVWLDAVANKIYSMGISAIKISITEINFAIIENKTQIEIKVKAYEERPSKVDEIENVYQYLKITIIGFENNETKYPIIIHFKASREWMKKNSIGRDNMRLFHYNDENKTWEELSTEIFGSDDDSIYYEAVTNSFSYFAVAGKEVEKVNETEVSTANTTTEKINSTNKIEAANEEENKTINISKEPEEKDENVNKINISARSVISLIIVALAIVLAVVFAFLIYPRIENRKIYKKTRLRLRKL